MRRAAVLLGVIILTGCARKEAPARNALPATAGAGADPSRLKRSGAHTEADLLASAASLLGGNGSLPAEDAERCWTSEKERPKVQELCALCWAAGPERSELLASELRRKAEGGSLSRPLAIALVRKELAGPLSLGALHGALGLLMRDPSWLRGKLLRDWLAAGNAAKLRHDPVNTIAILKAVQGPEEDPESLAARLNVGNQLALPEELLRGYCTAAASGPARSRCWRFLSTAIDPTTREGWSHRLRAFLPREYDPEWRLFEADFPERAALLRDFF